MEDKIDILLATYHPNIQYLKQQIDSLLGQTYPNFRLLIADDCSNDKEVLAILREYEKQDSRITVYEQTKNLGYVKNFEFLLKQSTAPYIMFCDQDDIWYPNKLEKSLATLKEENVDLVYVNSKQINEQNEVIKENYFQYKNMPLVKGRNEILGISRYLGIGCSQILTQAVKDKMIPFTDKVMAHDWLASFIANEGKGVSYLEEPLFSYRLHTSNVFGGRNLAQNLVRWKEKNGSTYESYLQYRQENVIDKAYLSGAIMCQEYTKEEANQNRITNLIQYYESIRKTKYINLKIWPYFYYLAGKNLGKKMIKEIMMFHFPWLGYWIFKLNKTPKKKKEENQ